MSIKTGKHHARVLIVLEGESLRREQLVLLPRWCVGCHARLDILLLNPPREPTSCLAMLLLKLEHGGIDYRLASSHGEMDEEVLRYLARHRGIGAIALADTTALGEAARERIAEKGMEILCFTSDRAQPTP